MQVLIHWNVFADVSTDEKCRKIVAKIQNRIGIPLDISNIERYWKDKHLFKIRATSRLEVPSNQEGFFVIMTRAGNLSRAWSISTPSENSPLEFGGATQPGSGLPPGIDSIGFNVELVDTEANTPLVHLG